MMATKNRFMSKKKKPTHNAATQKTVTVSILMFRQSFLKIFVLR